MRIAVLADTHNKLPPHLLGKFTEADEIWHLGDVVAETLLQSVRQLGPPVRIVRGNCDTCTQWPMEVTFVSHGFSVLLVHIPPPIPPAGVDLLFHGHTHVPRNEIVGRTRFLNPGCITRPNRGAPASYAWLDLSDERVFKWSLVRV